MADIIDLQQYLENLNKIQLRLLLIVLIANRIAGFFEEKFIKYGLTIGLYIRILAWSIVLFNYKKAKNLVLKIYGGVK